MKKQTSLAVAKAAMTEYIDLKEKKKKIDDKQKAAKETLELFATEFPEKFDEDNNLHLPGGYLHVAQESTIKPCEGFNLVEFVKAYPELVDRKFKTAALKAMLNTPEGKAKFTSQHCVELTTEEVLTIVVK